MHLTISVFVTNTLYLGTHTNKIYIIILNCMCELNVCSDFRFTGNIYLQQNQISTELKLNTCI